MMYVVRKRMRFAGQFDFLPILHPDFPAQLVRWALSYT